MNFNEQQRVENTGKQKHYLVGTIMFSFEIFERERVPGCSWMDGGKSAEIRDLHAIKYCPIKIRTDENFTLIKLTCGISCGGSLRLQNN